MDNVIYTYGGGEVLYYVFNAIAVIFGGGAGGLFTAMLRLATSIGGFWAIVNIILKNNVMHGINWFVWFLLATEIFFIPRTSVLIKDPITQFERHVDNVPLGLAVISSFFSKFGQVLTEAMENKFSLPDAWEYHKTGLVFGSKLLRSMEKVQITDSNFADNMNNFINQCVVLTSMIGRKYTVEDLRQSTDIWDLVKTNAQTMIGFPYREKGKAPEILSCKDGAAKIEGLWKSQVDRTIARMTKINLVNFVGGLAGKNQVSSDAAKLEFQSRLQSTFSELETVSKDAEHILRQQMMINKILNRQHPYAAAKAVLQQQNTYSIMGVLAEGLPLVKTVFEALMYGSFVFIVLIALFPGGHRVLFNYFQTIAWLQLWAPLNAILNLIITLTAKTRTMNLYEHGMTLANSIGIIRINDEMCSYAMYLSMLIPFIAVAIVRGGISSFVHLASHIGSGYQSAAAAVAGEVTSGNLSLGNISQRIRTYENMSMFQGSASPSFNTGQHQEVLPDGTLKTTNLDGTVVYASGSGRTTSTFATNLRASEQLSAQFSQNIAHEKSAIEARTQEISNLESTALKQAASFVERATLAQSSGESYDLGENTSSTKSIHNAVEMTKTLQNKFGLSTRQAAILAMSGSTPEGLGIVL